MPNPCGKVEAAGASFVAFDFLQAGLGEEGPPSKASELVGEMVDERFQLVYG